MEITIVIQVHPLLLMITLRYTRTTHSPTMTITPLLSRYSYSDYIATARWFVLMNYIVHSIMYSYYALKALKFKVSRFVSMFITTAQLAQMVMGAVVNIWAYQVKQVSGDAPVKGNTNI